MPDPTSELIAVRESASRTKLPEPLPDAHDGYRREMLVERNQTEAEYPRELCLHELFEAQAARSPDAVAVESDGKTLSYRDLNREANRLAAGLRRRGVGPESLVGICLNPSLNLMIGLLGILKAGGAYVALDPAYPEARLRFMMNDAAIAVLVTERALSKTLSSATISPVCLDELAVSAANTFDTNFASGAKPDNLAYVIYTSGSSGAPKGVMVPHRGLVNYLWWAKTAYGVDSGSGALVHSSISFDLTITGLFAPLLVGRCVFVLPRDTAASLGQALQGGSDFSLVKLTPAHLELLQRQIACSPAHAPTKCFVIGGESLLGESLQFWQKCAPDTILVNEYGPTETVVGCCAYVVPRGQTASGRIPIGRPVANTQLFVLDEKLQPVAEGATGELFIAGDGVARGYLNLPELTERSFVDNPFAALFRNSSPKMYKTGDLVRYLADGNLEFLGRADEQIKIRGFRIEPAEIEAVLLQHVEVQNAVVLARQNSAGDQQLVAYVVQSDKSTVAVAELRAFLGRQLPAYMLPEMFVRVPELPLTANGKVDRKSLASITGFVGEQVNTEPLLATPVERRLAEIWETALQQRVALDDNFFDLGGHSLLAVKVVEEINRAFGSEIDALTLYRQPTVSGLAGIVVSGTEAPGPKLVATREGGGGSPVVFLNAPLEFVRVAGLLNPEYSFLVSDVPFAPELVERARRGDITEFPTLEDIAAPHTSLLLSRDFAEPCYLAGFSSHGAVAFEVAHQLLNRGIAVNGVFLFDANMQIAKWDSLKSRAARHLREFLAHGLRYLFVRMRARAQQRQEERQAEQNRPAGEIPWRTDQRILNDALQRYVPRPLPTRGVLFRADISIYSEIANFDGCLGWRGLFSDGLDVVGVPGDHFTMWKEPGVTVLREAWDAALQRLRGPAVPSAVGLLTAITCSV